MKTTLSALAIIMGWGGTLSLSAQNPEAPQGFESPPILSATAILQPSFLQGPHFQVREAEPTSGGVNAYTINSDFGVFHASGNDLLMRRAGEIHAISATAMTGNLNELLRDNSPADLGLKNLGLLLNKGLSRALDARSITHSEKQLPTPLN